MQVLADRVNDLLDSFAGGAAGPSVDPLAGVPNDNAPLDTPIEEDFTVGTMGLSWDPERERLVIECHAVGDAYDSVEAFESLDDKDMVEEPDPATDPDSSSSCAWSSPRPPRAPSARRSASVVAAGRAPCPFCATPLDPQGHVCPRANGHKR